MESMLASLPLTTTITALHTGNIDLQQYINSTCDRIDASEPSLSAFVHEPRRRARLLMQATALQQRFPDPQNRPPLYGALLGVKDIFLVDGFPTSAGSQLPPSVFAGPEASCVSRLRAAGTLILGKTHTTEFAQFAPGPTRNPHNLAHTPGGSSSGSAAAVAAGLCPLALGTQTVGSTIRPAAFCGIVGFKPSYGRIPTDGLILCSMSIDTIGMFTQDVAGSALAASILCTQWQPSKIVDAQPVLGVPDGPYLAQASAEGRAAFEKHVSLLEHYGYKTRRVEILHDITTITSRHTQLVAAEMARVHSSWFSHYASLYHPHTAATIRRGQSIHEEEIVQAQNGQSLLRKELETIMTREGINLWISPAATGPAPEGIATTGDPAMNLPWTHAGLPAITLPAGLSESGLPFGLQVIGAFGTDEQLVSWADPLAKVLMTAYA